MLKTMLNTAYKNIIIDPNIMVGKPIIAGTRITVELILRQLAQRITIQEILQNYHDNLQGKFITATEYDIRIK